MAEDEDDPAVFWPLFETTGSDANEFGEDVGFVRDSMRCDAMRCDAMRCDDAVGGGRQSGDEGERERRETRETQRGKCRVRG